MDDETDTDLGHVRLGETGLSVSEIAFGTWRFGRETADGRVEIGESRAHDLLDAYAERGGRFVDTADVYGGGDSETWIGDWLATRDREEYVLASKVYWPTREGDPNGRGLGRKHLRRQVRRILERLGTDYLDVLYVHRWDEDTPTRELLRSLSRFVDDGRVLYLGASTLRPNGWRVARANEVARREGYEPFSVTQPRYNLVDREIEGTYLDVCRDEGLGVCPWSPLAQGFLTGKYEREADLPESSTASASDRWRDHYLTAGNFDVLDVVREVADAVGATPAQVAIAWQRHHEDLTAPIVGARTVDQLAENLAAATVDLSDEQVERLTAAKAGPYANL
jgi:aryl-alcohol dehydrogenase-like predicted oxidoreductase